MAGTESDIEADYVVIGAGSAGCVLASRLSEDGARVVLLEAGPTDWHPMIHVPAGVLKLLYNPRVNWNYATDPEPGVAGRQIHWPRGRVLGGSSSINGMLWIRGNPADYDGWSQMGCKGWSFDEVMPLLQVDRALRAGRRRAPRQDRADPGRGLPHDARTSRIASWKPPSRPASRSPATSTAARRRASATRRCRATAASAARPRAPSWRRPRGRPNLRIETNAFATRLLFDGKRCVGVAFRQKGQDRKVTAAREVILSGGTINSPHLLQVSGVGPGAHLKSIGVESCTICPAWAPTCPTTTRSASRIGSGTRCRSTSCRAGCGSRARSRRWLTTGRGALTFGVSSAQAFARSREGLASPDIQLLFSPASYDQNKFGALEREPGMTVAVSIARPESRGTIMAKSADPFVRPSLKPNYLSAPNDMRVALRGDRADATRVRGARAWPGTAWGRRRPARRSPASRRSATTCAGRARPSITSSAPAGWARTRWPWSMPG